MKIHFIISSLGGGGAERVATLIGNRLANKKNYDISFITLLKRDDDYTIDSAIKRITLKESKFLPSHTLRSILKLSKFYFNKKNRPDIIISLLTLNNFIAIIVAKLFSIKIIAQEHNSHLRYMKNRKLISLFTKKYLYKKSDLITVLTSFDVNYYENFGANVYVMPNPCSFVPIKNSCHTREKIILAVGNLNRYHHKGFDNLIALIAPVLKKNADWKLKIVGSGDDGLKHLQSLIIKHDISNNVIFTGFINNVYDIMHNSSIYILSSRFEGLPMVLLEAMSQGMACIAYDCKTGPSDIITNGVNGLLIEDQNAHSMQINLQKLIENDRLRMALANEGIKSLDKYHIDSVISQYERIFKQILSKKPVE